MITQKAHQRKLQGSTIEIIKAYQIISHVVEQLSDICSNKVKEFQPIVEKSRDMLNISKIKLEVPRSASR